MVKICLFFVLFIFFLSANSSIDYTLLQKNQRIFTELSLRPHIISRSEWGADESLRYQENYKFSTNMNIANVGETTIEGNQEKTDKINKYLNDFFFNDNKITYKNAYVAGHTLIWPEEKTDYVKAIIVHHTHTEYKDSYEGLREIYTYHAQERGWGDIGYNYVIGTNGEIFEGRAGGDYVVGAHTQWDNKSTVGIALMGDYDKKPISIKQYDALKKLIRYLNFKYGINMNDTFPYHKECIGISCQQALITQDGYPIAGHRDAGHTTCPGEKLYSTIQAIRKSFSEETKSYTPVKNMN